MTSVSGKEAAPQWGMHFLMEALKSRRDIKAGGVYARSAKELPPLVSKDLTHKAWIVVEKAEGGKFLYLDAKTVAISLHLSEQEVAKVISSGASEDEKIEALGELAFKKELTVAILDKDRSRIASLFTECQQQGKSAQEILQEVSPSKADKSPKLEKRIALAQKVLFSQNLTQAVRAGTETLSKFFAAHKAKKDELEAAITELISDFSATHTDDELETLVNTVHVAMSREAILSEDYQTLRQVFRKSIYPKQIFDRAAVGLEKHAHLPHARQELIYHTLYTAVTSQQASTTQATLLLAGLTKMDLAELQTRLKDEIQQESMKKIEKKELREFVDDQWKVFQSQGLSFAATENSSFAGSSVSADSHEHVADAFNLKDAAFTIIRKEYAEKNDASKLSNWLLSHVKGDEEKTKFLQEIYLVVALGAALENRDVSSINSLYQQCQRLTNEPTKLLKEAVERHPKLSEKEYAYAIEVISKSSVLKELQTALKAGNESAKEAVKVYDKRFDFDPLFKEACLSLKGEPNFVDCLKIFLNVSLGRAISKRDDRTLIALVTEARANGLDPRLLIEEALQILPSVVQERFNQTALLYDAITQRDSNAFRTALEKVVAQDRSTQQVVNFALANLLPNHPTIPETCATWAKFADERYRDFMIAQCQKAIIAKDLLPLRLLYEEQGSAAWNIFNEALDRLPLSPTERASRQFAFAIQNEDAKALFSLKHENNENASHLIDLAVALMGADDPEEAKLLKHYAQEGFLVGLIEKAIEQKDSRTLTLAFDEVKKSSARTQEAVQEEFQQPFFKEVTKNHQALQAAIQSGNSTALKELLNRVLQAHLDATAHFNHALETVDPALRPAALKTFVAFFQEALVSSAQAKDWKRLDEMLTQARRSPHELSQPINEAMQQLKPLSAEVKNLYSKHQIIEKRMQLITSEDYVQLKRNFEFLSQRHLDISTDLVMALSDIEAKFGQATARKFKAKTQEALQEHHIQALVSSLEANDMSAVRQVIQESRALESDARRLIEPVAKLVTNQTMLDQLWKEIETDKMQQAILAANFKEVEQLFAVSVQNTHGLQPKALFEEALKRLTKEMPDHPHVRFMNAVLLSIENLAPLIEQREQKGMRLSLLEMFQISSFALKKLTDASKTEGAIRVAKREANLPRSLQIDYTTHSFFVLSKKAGTLQAKGGMKHITEAFEVQAGGKPDQAKRWVRAVNQRGVTFNANEITYEEKYGNLRSFSSYTSRKENKPTVEKTSFIIEAFDHDLTPFIVKSSKSPARKLPANSVALVGYSIGKQIGDMHANDDVHRDLKCLNILYRILNGVEEIKVSDYGLTYAPLTDYERASIFYGTPHYTAPERLKEARPTTPQARLAQAKADDMYAIGCILHELLHNKPIPWGDAIGALRSDKELKKKDEALQIQEASRLQLQQEIAKLSEGKEKRLYEVCLKLLDPDPKTRLNIQQYTQAVRNIL